MLHLAASHSQLGTIPARRTTPVPPSVTVTKHVSKREGVMIKGFPQLVLGTTKDVTGLVREDMSASSYSESLISAWPACNPPWIALQYGGQGGVGGPDKASIRKYKVNVRISRPGSASDIFARIERTSNPASEQPLGLAGGELEDKLAHTLCCGRKRHAPTVCIKP
jgi:hypothetical protein